MALRRSCSVNGGMLASLRPPCGRGSGAGVGKPCTLASAQEARRGGGWVWEAGGGGWALHHALWWLAPQKPRRRPPDHVGPRPAARGAATPAHLVDLLLLRRLLAQQLLRGGCHRHDPGGRADGQGGPQAGGPGQGCGGAGRAAVQSHLGALHGGGSQLSEPARQKGRGGGVVGALLQAALTPRGRAHEPGPGLPAL